MPEAATGTTETPGTAGRESPITTIAREVVKDFEGIDSAALELLDRVRANPALYAVFHTGDADVKRAKEYISQVYTGQRRAAMSMEAGPSKPNPRSGAHSPGRLSALANAGMASLMDMPLIGGKKLGDATGPEVFASAREYLAKGTDFMRKGRWLESIGKKIGKNKVVRDVFTEDQLVKLRESVKV